MNRLSTLKIPSLNESMINKLQAMKIFTVLDFLSAESDKLIKLTGLPYMDILKLKTQLTEEYGGKEKNAVEWSLEERNVNSTGIIGVDNLLNGGLHPGQIYEICGKSSSGKSQLCYSIALNIAIEGSGIVYFIYTAKDFSASKIQMILDNKKIHDEIAGRAMNQIKVTHAEDIFQLLNILHSFSTSFKTNSNTKKPKLIIIDSLSGIFFMSDKNSDNFSSLNHLANICHFLAKEFFLSIITVNIVTQPWRTADGFDATLSIPVKPALGKYWRHIPYTRLLIEKEDNEARKITIWMCDDTKVGSSAQIIINNTGVI